MRKKTVAIVTAVAFLGSGVVGGLLFFSNQKVDSTNRDLQEELADVKEKQSDLTEQLEKAEEEAARAEDHGQEPEPSAPDEDGPAETGDGTESITATVAEGIATALTNMERKPQDYEIEDIRESGGWATGQARPKDGSDDPTLFLFKSESGAWRLMDAGKGLKRASYPDSPDDVWP